MKAMKAMNSMKSIRVGTITVIAALKDADIPLDAKKMLSQALKLSLTVYADERHESQQSIVEMAQEAFAGIEKRLEAAVADAHVNITSIDEEKLQALVAHHARERANIKGIAASAEAALVQATINAKKAQEALSVALTRQKAEDTEFNELASQKVKFDQTFERLALMKNSENNSRDIGRLTTDLKAYGVDTSIAATLHSVLTKKPTERGEFDHVTLANLDAELASRAKAVDAQLNILSPGKEERSAAAAHAQASRDAAKEQVEVAKVALHDANKNVANCENVLANAEDTLGSIAKNVRLAQGTLKKREERLAHFQSGPLQTFRDLASGNRPVPEPQLGMQAEEGMDVC